MLEKKEKAQEKKKKLKVRSYEEINLYNKTVFLRIDINSPVENGKIIDNPRIEEHSYSIKKLANKGAKVVLLAHQGRPGENDFTSLEEHAKLLSEHSKIKVKFCKHIIGKEVEEQIKKLKPGDVLLLNNVRMLSDEMENPNSLLVNSLSKFGDYFVLDALSVAHRNHGSVVGFTKHMPSFAGPVLIKELKALSILDSSPSVTLILGGAKVEDSIEFLKKVFKKRKVKYVLLGGLVATLFLFAKDLSIGNSYFILEKKNYLRFVDDAKALLSSYGKKIILPLDVGLKLNEKRVESNVNEIKEGEIFDISEKTLFEFKKAIFSSEFIFMNGPLGVYEEKDFEWGTKHILEALSRARAFTLIGGGHTIAAIKKFGLSEERFGHLSLSGKALLEYIAGEELVGIKSLEENAIYFK